MGMVSRHSKPSDRAVCCLLGTVGVGAIAGIVATLGIGLGRRVVALARTGQGHPPKQRVLDVASALLQRKRPLESISTHLNGVHCYAGELGRQVEATHLCSHLRHDLHQCVIFDSNTPDARLIGIEYIITEERFRELPEDEKRLWHSHHYEVSSGLLVAPGVPGTAEHAYVEDLVSTYGKTFHTWQYYRHDFPYGIPQLMMGLTGDGQVDDDLVARRDRRLGVSTAVKRRSRTDIEVPPIVPGANGWESGRTVQTAVVERDVRGQEPRHGGDR